MSEQNIADRVSLIESRLAQLESRADAVKKTLEEIVSIQQQTHACMSGSLSMSGLMFQQMQNLRDGDLLVWRFIVSHPVFPEDAGKKAFRDMISKAETESDLQAAALRDLISKTSPPPPPPPRQQPGK